MQDSVLPVFLFIACVVVIAAGLLLIARLVTPRRSDPVKMMPYESGMDPIHDTRRRFTVRFHLVAIAFLVFEVELLFLYPWAVAQRPASQGTGQALAVPQGIDAAVAQGAVESRGLVFAAVMVFLGVLVLGFVYDWRKGVFRWR
jgi:NADH-quinone oxidoreductase subunit A